MPSAVDVAILKVIHDLTAALHAKDTAYREEYRCAIEAAWRRRAADCSPDDCADIGQVREFAARWLVQRALGLVADDVIDLARLRDRFSTALTSTVMRVTRSLLKGRGAPAIEDMSQRLTLELLLDRQRLRHWKPSRSWLPNFVRLVAEQMLVDDARGAKAQKRGGGRRPVSLEHVRSIIDGGSLPDECAHYREAVRGLASWFDEQPDSDKEIYRLLLLEYPKTEIVSLTERPYHIIDRRHQWLRAVTSRFGYGPDRT